MEQAMLSSVKKQTAFEGFLRSRRPAAAGGERVEVPGHDAGRHILRGQRQDVGRHGAAARAGHGDKGTRTHAGIQWPGTVPRGTGCAR